jgi:hypothetical protein
MIACIFNINFFLDQSILNKYYHKASNFHFNHRNNLDRCLNTDEYLFFYKLEKNLIINEIILLYHLY